MPKINVYLPEQLASRVRASDINVSSVCQQALERALQERNTIMNFTTEARPVEVSLRDGDGVARMKRFMGRHIASGHGSRNSTLDVYVTAKGALAVVSDFNDSLHLYDDLAAMQADGFDPDLMSDVASALGADYIIDLDI